MNTSLAMPWHPPQPTEPVVLLDFDGYSTLFAGLVRSQPDTSVAKCGLTRRGTRNLDERRRHAAHPGPAERPTGLHICTRARKGADARDALAIAGRLLNALRQARAADADHCTRGG